METGSEVRGTAGLAALARQHVLDHGGACGRPLTVCIDLDARLDLLGVRVELPPLPPPEPAGEEPHRALLDVVALLARTGHRLTTTFVLAGLAEQGTPHGDALVKRVLAAAVEAGRLTNDPEASPRGYGLPHW